MHIKGWRVECQRSALPARQWLLLRCDSRLFGAGQEAAVAAATAEAQRQVPTTAMVLAWSGTVVLLATLGAVSFARCGRAGQISAAVVEGTVRHLMQENQAEADHTDGAADVA